MSRRDKGQNNLARCGRGTEIAQQGRDVRCFRRRWDALNWPWSVYYSINSGQAAAGSSISETSKAWPGGTSAGPADDRMGWYGMTLTCAKYLRHIVTRGRLVVRGWTKTAFPRDGISEVYRAPSISVMTKGNKGHHAVGGVIRKAAANGV